MISKKPRITHIHITAEESLSAAKKAVREHRGSRLHRASSPDGVVWFDVVLGEDVLERHQSRKHS